MLSQLCASCRTIFGLSYQEWNDQYFQHHSQSDLETVAAQGCHLCTIFAHQMQEFRRVYQLDSTAPLLIGINSRDIRIETANRAVVSHVVSFREDEIPNQQISNIMDRTDSNASFAVGSKWLSDCTRFHTSCSEFKSNRCKLPTRLLRISRTEAGYKIRLRVSSIPSDSQYTTLSHFWGSIHVLKLKRRNLEIFQRDIPTHQLTKTFQDAISITYRLGFRYLWVDSLCIIQDDPEDWRRESVAMESVYGGSSLNIAASVAPDGNTGCFFNRNPYFVEGCRFMRTTTTSEIPTLHYALSANFYSGNITESPLSKRAWVFQELHLAPRTLSFGAEQIFWECRDLTACESFPLGIPPILLPISSWNRLREQKSDPNKLWTDIVSSYSPRLLTRESDKLVALSGVAKQFAEQFSGEYLAGMWKENLIEQLAWYISTWDDTQPKTYRAPSWSWASVNGRVNFRPQFWERRIDHIRFVDAQISTTTSSPFGEVENAFLQIPSRALVKAKVSADQDLEGGKLQASRYDLLTYNVWYDRKAYKPSENIYFLPLYENNTSIGVLMLGLVVEVAQDQRGTFRRVAHFKIQDKSSLADFEMSRNTRAACAEDSMYQSPAGVDELGRQLYILKII